MQGEEEVWRGGHRSLPWQRKTQCFLSLLDLEESEMKAVPSVRKNQGCMKTHLLVLLAERFCELKKEVNLGGPQAGLINPGRLHWGID